MSNVVKICLYHDEIKLACTIVAFYEIILDKEIITRVIQRKQYDFLYYVWTFDKNYYGPRNLETAEFITFEALFNIILEENDS
jgi:hypothetical protein